MFNLFKNIWSELYHYLSEMAYLFSEILYQ